MELLGSIEMTSDATTLDLHVNASTIVLILEMTIPFGMSMRLAGDRYPLYYGTGPPH